MRLDQPLYLTKTISYCGSDDPGIRLSAITALGEGELGSEDGIRIALSAFQTSIAADTDDRSRALVLVSACRVAARHPAVCAPWLPVFAAEILASPGPIVRNACAEALLFHSAAMSTDLIDQLLSTLAGVDPGQTATLNAIDLALAQLLRSGHGDRAITFLTQILVSDDGKPDLKEFRSFSHALTSGDGRVLAHLVVRFFLTGEPSLCEAAASLVKPLLGTPIVLDIDFSTNPITPKEAAYLARKAMGYFVLQPVTTASFLVSLLRHVQEPIANEIRQLLFDPLLVNYGGATREYLERVVASGVGSQATPHVARALADQDRYMEGLRSIGTVAEFYPTERQRRMVAEREHDLIQRALRDARAQSPFMSLVRRSVVLNGSRSISRVGEPGGETRRMDIKLGRVETSMELPRTQLFDPLGLDYTIRVFRAERPPK